MTFELNKIIDDTSTDIKPGTVVYYANNLEHLKDFVETEKVKGVLTGVTTFGRFRITANGGEVDAKYIYPAGEVVEETRAFLDVNEFIYTYEHRVCKNPAARPPHTMPLIWVKHKNSNTVELVTAFCDDGIEMGGTYMTWGYFVDAMVFLDNSPCGVEIC